MTKRVSIRRCVLAAALAVAASMTAHGASGWREVAQQTLMTELQKAHPLVVSWQIEPLLGQAQLARLQSLSVMDAKAIAVGSRSAVRMSYDGRKHMTVWFRVSGLQPVLTSRSHIKAGSVVDDTAGVPDERDVISLGCEPLTSTDQLIEQRATRSFAAGAALCADGFEPRPAVARGESVLVRSVSGAVIVVARGIALQDGAVGQVLQIRNPTSRRTYRAAVTGAREVTVHE